jgi:hypothetical protein
MKNGRGLSLLILSLGCLAALVLFSSPVSAQVDSAQTNGDAIGVRIIPNPNHYSVTQWYNEQDFTGSPQSIIVNGYPAIRRVFHQVLLNAKV